MAEPGMMLVPALMIKRGFAAPSCLPEFARRAGASVWDSSPATARDRRLPTLIFALAAMATRIIDTMILSDIVMRWYGE